MGRSDALKSVGCVALLLGGLLATTAVCAEDAEEESKIASLKGCYQITKGALYESSVNPKAVIGTYKLSLKLQTKGQQKPRDESITLKGPLSGSEGGTEGAPAAAEGEGPHGGHVFGTHGRIGTLSTEGDEVQVLDASCPGGDGVPRLIKGIETLKFSKGTGVFSNVVSGQMSFDLHFDGCTKPDNPVANLTLRQGEICFK
jgi:hypothetical protein